MATSSKVGTQIADLVEEIETDARIAAKALPSGDLDAWVQVGSVPLMARAAWSDALEMAQQAEALGQRVDLERIFRGAMGPRAFGVLMGAVGKGRR